MIIFWVDIILAFISELCNILLHGRKNTLNILYGMYICGSRRIFIVATIPHLNKSNVKWWLRLHIHTFYIIFLNKQFFICYSNNSGLKWMITDWQIGTWREETFLPFFVFNLHYVNCHCVFYVNHVWR